MKGVRTRLARLPEEHFMGHPEPELTLIKWGTGAPSSAAGFWEEGGGAGVLCQESRAACAFLLPSLPEAYFQAFTSQGLRPAGGTHPALSLPPKPPPNLVLRTNGLLPQAQSLSV